MQELIKAARAGDTSAWNILYRQHQPWLYAIALRICGNDPAAKDAVQDTFMQAYLKLQQLRDHLALAAWLKTTLIRYCYRSKYQNNLYNTHAVPVNNDSYWEDEINKGIDNYADQSRIYDVLCNLSEPLQSVLLLRYFSSWQSYDQIATILCIPVGTVRSRLNQARQKMMEHWRQSNDDNDDALREARQWNYLYTDYFGNMYDSLSCREKFIDHIDKNLQLIFTSGKIGRGVRLIENLIEEDLQYGSSICNIQVMSSGSISIVEMQNINSTEYPDHCPNSTVLVLYRNKNKVSRLNLHDAR